MKYVSSKQFIVFTLLASLFVGVGGEGASVQELEGKIEDRNTQIEKLEGEIKQYQKEIEETGKQANTLQNTVKTLDVTNKKLGADIQITEKKITTANLSIEELSDEITLAEQKIEENLQAIAGTIRKLNMADDLSLVENLLTYNTVSILWDEIEALERFQTGIKAAVADLEILKGDFEEKRGKEETRKRELTGLKNTLSDQKRLVVENKQEKDSLLKQTKNKEAEYKKILDEKQQQKEIFERELSELESELRVTIDPNSFPKGGAVFSWPFDTSRINPFKNITQLFGGTEFAKLNPQVYGRPFHNGTDFGMPTGTGVKAPLKGVVQDSGNTDAFPGCYSYGKWVLVRHANGLSTLYAHLSLIKVNTGEAVAEGQLLGYSGNTGYSTGPHLHFTVYASQGVQVIRFGETKKVTNCADARIPVAPYGAYLDPLTYLPQS